MRYELADINLPHLMMPENGESIEITRRSKAKEPLPSYTMVGNGIATKHGTSLDVLKVCGELNQAEIKLLCFFRDVFAKNAMNKEENPNKIEPLSWVEFDKYLATALKKNYVHMEYIDVVIRVKRGIYMVNPLMFIPSTNFTKILAEWQQYKGKQDDVHV
ncbi:MAG: hypothetical protein EOM36_04080 [Bacteroidia bacterium]|nr:hypothetical protein [Bacteroidia bacterium]